MKQELINKAKQSVCRYKIAAFGFNRKGELIGKATNRPRLDKYHGGLHAEMALLLRYGSSIHTIILCRVNKSGNFLPIHPCHSCSKVLTAMSIKVVTIKE